MTPSENTLILRDGTIQLHLNALHLLNAFYINTDKSRLVIADL